MRKILLCLSAAVLISQNVFAADLSSVIYDHTVATFVDGFSYVTTDGKLCIKRISKSDESESGYDVVKTGKYFENVKAISNNFTYYNQALYQRYTYELPYYIKEDGTVWNYKIEDGNVITQQVKGISNAIEVYSVEYLGFALEKNGKIKYWNQVDDDPVAYEIEGIDNIVDISASAYWYGIGIFPDENEPVENEYKYPAYLLAVDSYGNAYQILFNMFF